MAWKWKISKCHLSISLEAPAAGSVEFPLQLYSVHTELLSCAACNSQDGDKRFHTEWTEASQDFDEMNLKDDLFRGIVSYRTLLSGSCPCNYKTARHCPRTFICECLIVVFSFRLDLFVGGSHWLRISV